jgi:hypothetical protein
MPIPTLILLVAMILSGFNAGIEFGNAIGYMPGFADTPAPHAFSVWQNIDRYFAKGMPVFGDLLLLSMILSLILWRGRHGTPGYNLPIISFLLHVSEGVVIFRKNLPINKVIKTLSTENPDTIKFGQLRNKVRQAFRLRSLLTITSFITIAIAFVR